MAKRSRARLPPGAVYVVYDSRSGEPMHVFAAKRSALAAVAIDPTMMVRQYTLT